MRAIYTTVLSSMIFMGPVSLGDRVACVLVTFSETGFEIDTVVNI